MERMKEILEKLNKIFLNCDKIYNNNINAKSTRNNKILFNCVFIILLFISVIKLFINCVKNSISIFGSLIFSQNSKVLSILVLILPKATYPELPLKVKPPPLFVVYEIPPLRVPLLLDEDKSYHVVPDPG